jgi:hypothetical protein
MNKSLLRETILSIIQEKIAYVVEESEKVGNKKPCTDYRMLLNRFAVLIQQLIKVTAKMDSNVANYFIGDGSEKAHQLDKSMTGATTLTDEMKNVSQELKVVVNKLNKCGHEFGDIKELRKNIELGISGKLTGFYRKYVDIV